MDMGKFCSQHWTVSFLKLLQFKLKERQQIISSICELLCLSVDYMKYMSFHLSFLEKTSHSDITAYK